MPFAKLPDAQLFYQWDGPENAPVLVFSNSLGTTHHMWDPQVEAFSKHFRLLRYDTRGHGQSTVTPGPYTIEKLAADVLHLFDTLKIERAYFCGLSMGGMIGMQLGSHAAGYAACCGAVRDLDSREQLHRVDAPTLVIAGAHDPATPSADGRFLADHIRGAKFHELAAAHLSNIEASEQFNREILEFLQSQGAHG